MKILRNPWVVGLLGLLAFGVAAWNVLGPLKGRSPARRNAVATTTAPLPTSGAATAPVPAGELTATPPAPPAPDQTPIEESEVRTRFVHWLEAPRRDPFEVFVVSAPVPTGPRASEILSLKAIWRQAAGQLVVVNKVVLGVGDEISGFKVERIEADSIWVRGTNGSERVEFGSIANPTNPSAPKP